MHGSGEAVGTAPPWLSDLRLSLVVPAYNEGQRLEAGVSRLLTAIAGGAIDVDTTEFVVVDDGSSDDTTPRARELFAAFPHVQHVRLAENRGKGGAVRAGVALARAPIVIFADADMAIDPAQTPQFIRALKGAGVAIGSRSASGSSVDRPSLQRSVMNRSFNWLVNVITRVSLADTQCGFKAFHAGAAKLLFHCSVTERFAFDVEILSLARRLGLTIAEVPVDWRRVQGSQIRPWFDARSMAGDVLRAGRGTAWAPPVPTVRVTFPGAGTEGSVDPVSLRSLRQALAPWLPVFESGGGRLLVLCPQMSELQIATAARWIASNCEGAALERSVITVKQLCHMAPLSWTWGEDHVVPERGPVHPIPIVAKDARP